MGRMERRIEYMRLDSIMGAEANPKLHAEDALDQSITRFGAAEVPLLDERTGRLVAGHGRIDAFRRLAASGAAAPNGVRVDPDGAWQVPIVRGWASKDDAEGKACA